MLHSIEELKDTLYQQIETLAEESKKTSAPYLTVSSVFCLNSAGSPLLSDKCIRTTFLNAGLSLVEIKSSAVAGSCDLLIYARNLALLGSQTAYRSWLPP